MLKVAKIDMHPGADVFISCLNDFLRLRKEYLAGEGPVLLAFEMNADKSYTIKVRSQRMCAYFGDLTLESAILPDGEGGTERVAKFSRAFVTVEINVKRVNQFKRGIWIDLSDTSEPKAYVAAGRGKWQNLCTNQLEVKPNGCLHYKVFFTSPSGERQEVVYFYNATTHEDRVFFNSLANKVTTGSYAKYEGEEVTIGSGNKLNLRHACGMAPSKNWGVIYDYAITSGKLANGLNDGTCYFRASALSIMLSVNGRRFSPEALVGLCFQSRPSGVSKVQLVCLADDHFDLVWHSTESFVCYGAGKPNLLLDSNGLKADFDFGQPINLEVLDIAQMGPGTISGQIVDKLIGNLGLQDLIKKLFLDQVAEAMEPINSGEPTMAGLKTFDIAEGRMFPAAQILSMLAPSIMLKDRTLFESGVAGGIAKHLMKTVNSFGYGIDGGFFTAQSDPAALFGTSVIPFSHIFVAGEIGRKQRGTKTIAAKYPSMGKNELYAPIVLCDLDMPDLIAANKDLNREQRIALIHYFRTLQQGVTVVSACVELMKLLAGFDFDWDKLLLIFCSFFLSLLENFRPLIVNILTDEVKVPDEIIGNYSIDLLPTIVLETLRRQRSGLTVGEITNTNSVYLELGSADLATQQGVLSQVFGNEPTQEYVGLSYSTRTIDGVEVDWVDVSPSDEERISKEISLSVLDSVSIPKILKDLNVLYRLLQEMTIDSVKTGRIVAPHHKVSPLQVVNMAAQVPFTLIHKRGGAFSISHEMM